MNRCAEEIIGGDVGIIRQPVCIFRTEQETEADLVAETPHHRELQVAMNAELLPDARLQLEADEVLTEGLSYTVSVAAQDGESAIEALRSIGLVGRLEQEGRRATPLFFVILQLFLIVLIGSAAIRLAWILVTEILGDRL